jgi:hypothetical protein
MSSFEQHRFRTLPASGSRNVETMKVRFKGAKVRWRRAFPRRSARLVSRCRAGAEMELFQRRWLAIRPSPAASPSLPRGRDGRADAPLRLERLPSRSARALAAGGQNDRRHPPLLQVPDVHRLGTGAALPLQRCLCRRARPQASCGARPCLRGHLGGHLGRYRADGPPRARRGSDLLGESAVDDDPQGLFRADLVHFLLQPPARRRRNGRRHVLRLRRDHRHGEGRAGAARERGAVPADRRFGAGADVGHPARPRAQFRQPRLCRVPRHQLRGSGGVRLADGDPPRGRAAGARRIGGRRGVAADVRTGLALPQRQWLALASLHLAAALGAAGRACRLHRRCSRHHRAQGGRGGAARDERDTGAARRRAHPISARRSTGCRPRSESGYAPRRRCVRRRRWRRWAS